MHEYKEGAHKNKEVKFRNNKFVWTEFENMFA